MDKHLVFVYGTLRRTEHNYPRFLMAPDVRDLGDGTIDGELYALGRLPVVVLSTLGTVHGELYEVSPCVLRQLDELEGVDRDGYERATVVCSLNDGTTHPCFVYHVPRRRLGGYTVRVEGDDWKRYLDNWRS